MEVINIVVVLILLTEGKFNKYELIILWNF
jgi:hypothetical protein